MGLLAGGVGCGIRLVANIRLSVNSVRLVTAVSSKFRLVCAGKYICDASNTVVNIIIILHS